MGQINPIRTTEMFTGAYNKRVEQNKYKAAAEAYQEQPKQNTGERSGVTITISKESQEFMAGAAERKAAQAAAHAAAMAEVGEQYSGNAFTGTGDLNRSQYLVFSNNLYNSGFYDSMSDEEVQKMEGMLQDITSGMNSINLSSLNINKETQMSHEAAKLELTSSVNALRYFSEKFVPEEMRESFNKLIDQYESHNSEKVASHRNSTDMRDEFWQDTPLPNTKDREEAEISREIGKVTHTEEEEKKNKADYQTLFEQLMQGQGDTGSIFDSLKNTLIQFASGGSKNSNVLALLNSRNSDSISNMMSYWSKLL